MKNHANLIREFIDDVLNHGNIEATGEYFHEDVVELARFPGQGPGLNGLKDVLHRFHAAFPNMHWLVEEQIEEGDKVVSRFVWTGTLRAEFLGVPATVAECPFGG
jgi:predicted ester cyclase